MTTSGIDRAAPARRGAERNLSATDRVYLALKEQILTVHLAPDSVVLEQDLAEEFGVSKTPVRDALRLLAHEGWVTIIPRRGYLVRSLRLEDVTELFALRQMIEPPLAGQAAERGTPAQKAQLAELLDRQKEETDPEVAFQTAVAFHLKIAEMARNSRAEKVLRDLLEELYRIRNMLPWVDTALQQPDEIIGHGGILQAILDGDAEQAVHRMDQHSRESLVQKFQGLSSLR